MITWSEALVIELAARRCIIFMGSGISAGCRAADGARPPTWRALLESIAPRAQLSQGDRAFFANLLDKEKYLDAAEILVTSTPRADFDASIREQLETPRFNPSPVHRAILTIDPKIVITTNFDTIYDRFAQEGDAIAGYNTYKYTDTHLPAGLRSPIRCIVKAHGCVTDPDSLVLSRSQYFEARRKKPNFFRLLDSLFLTNTLLFLGYSVSDPDIQLMLENSTIVAPENYPHYLVTEAGTHPTLKNSMKRTYNLQFLEYATADHAELEASVSDLAERVVEVRQENPDT